MGNIFFEITIVLCLVAALSIIFKLLRQPLILAYILTGIIIGPFGQLQLGSKDFLQTMGEIGITLLLFMVGLELKLKELRTIGRVALITGIGQIFFTSVIGYFISMALGFSWIVSLYISIALTFSSTIIIIKLLSDKKDLNSLYGKISVGFLLVQDFFAILALILLSGFNSANSGSFFLADFTIAIIKGIILFIIVIYASKSILPKIVDKIAHSTETLFLFSIAWVFGMAAIVSSSFVGFSIEIGGFLAGLALANSTENFQIVARIKTLRDFFITLFFVILGVKMVFSNVASIWFPTIVFSLFILIGNPLIVMIIMGLMGYRRRTSFLAGLTVAQISEFSLILVFLGNKLGHLSSEVVSLVTLVGVITFTSSTYMILNGNKLYKYLNSYLRIFEKKSTKEQTGNLEHLEDHIVLVGGNRTGQGILESLRDQLNEKIVVVDFNPDVIANLKDKGFITLFGDISDPYIQEKIQLEGARLVISTSPDIEDNLLLIEALNHINKSAKIIVIAQDQDEEKVLYKAGADYVVLPHLASGRHIAKMLEENNLEKIESFKTKDLDFMK